MVWEGVGKIGKPDETATRPRSMPAAEIKESYLLKAYVVS